MVRDFNCTPTEARDELLGNPWIWDVLVQEDYRVAFIAVEAWHSLTPEQRKGREPPEGDMVARVEANMRREKLAEMAERRAALKRAGRV